MRTRDGTVADEPVGGDADLTVVAGALADRGRARMVLAVTDGRALPASVVASAGPSSGRWPTAAGSAGRSAGGRSP